MSSEKVDAYIEEAPAYAAPILTHLRKLVREALPGVEEQIKWKMPAFERNGKIVVSMAAYKKHCVMRFWRGDLMSDPEGILQPVGQSNMRHFGNVKSMEELPSDEVLLSYLKEAEAVIPN